MVRTEIESLGSLRRDPEADSFLVDVLERVIAMTGALSAEIYRLDAANSRVFRVQISKSQFRSATPDWVPLGLGLLGECAATGRVVRSDDVSVDSRVLNLSVALWADTRSILVVPLVADGACIGVLLTRHTRVGFFGSEHETRLSAFARDIGPVLQRRWEHEDADTARDGRLLASSSPRTVERLRLRRVREVSARMHQAWDVDEILRTAVAGLAELIWGQRVVALLVDPRDGVIRGRCGLGLPNGDVTRIECPLFAEPSPDEDVHSAVVRTGQPLLIRADDPDHLRENTPPGGRQKLVLVVPLCGQSRVLGTLSASWSHAALVDSETLDIAMVLADHAGRSIEALSFLNAERRQRHVLERLHQIAQQITLGHILDDALAVVLRAVEEMFGAQSASVFLTEQEGVLHPRRYTTRYTGQPHWDDVQGRDRVAFFPMEAALRTGQPQVVDDVPSAEEGSRTMAVVPIRYGEHIRGVLSANWLERRRCEQMDLDLLGVLGAYAAIVIERVRIHRRLVEVARLDGVLLATNTVADDIEPEIRVTLDLAYRIRATGSEVDPALLDGVIASGKRIASNVRQLLDVVYLAREPGSALTVMDDVHLVDRDQSLGNHLDNCWQ